MSPIPGTEPAEHQSNEDREVVTTNQQHRHGLDWSTQARLDERQARIEGHLAPTCSCGWRGYREPWETPGTRSPNGGPQFNSHLLNAQLTAATQRQAAATAAAALRHAAEAWAASSA